MLLNNRIIWKDNSDLKDISAPLSDFASNNQVIDFVSAEDALYFGSDMPFNHRFFDLVVVNSAASSVSVSIWDGTEFNAAVDLIDLTKSSAGASLAQSGIISWVTDRNKTWSREDTTENISDLSTLKIYNMFWVKLTFSANLSALMSLNYIGHKFCDDSNLTGLYPELGLSAIKDSFKSGKTDWEEQEILASETVIRDLRVKRELWSSNQILEWERFQEAAVHKTAELIFSSFGQDYENDRDRARRYYKEAIGSSRGGIDKNADGRLQIEEKFTISEFRRR